MPYKTRKVRGKDCYRLMNKNTKKVFAKCSSKKNIEKQLKLLNAIKYNKNFVSNSMRRSVKSKN